MSSEHEQPRPGRGDVCRTLLALLDRLIPEDDCPGALAAGVDEYVRRQLAGDCAGEASTIEAGLLSLEAHGFADIPEAAQDEILVRLDESGDPFFSRMVVLANEGFYADPGNGGNRNAVAWQMVGYQTNIPGRP
jgi:hypothetical protein